LLSFIKTPSNSLLAINRSKHHTRSTNNHRTISKTQTTINVNQLTPASPHTQTKPTTTTQHPTMSAALKATSVLGGLAVFATATLYSTRQTSDFSSSALAAAEHSATEISAVVKPKL